MFKILSFLNDTHLHSLSLKISSYSAKSDLPAPDLFCGIYPEDNFFPEDLFNESIVDMVFIQGQSFRTLVMEHLFYLPVIGIKIIHHRFLYSLTFKISTNEFKKNYHSKKNMEKKTHLFHGLYLVEAPFQNE
jgi:hypothetical protein